jgi:polyisoprenoid-binding protein YceI
MWPKRAASVSPLTTHIRAAAIHQQKRSLVMHLRSATQFFLALALASVGAASAWAEQFTIDAGHSSVLFRVKHMGASNAWGRFDNIAGTVDLDEADPAKSSVDITVLADSVNTGAPKRDEHLRGPDFFNVRQFPKITFKSQSVRAAGASAYEVTGTLTLHGVSHPLTVKLEKIGNGQSPQGEKLLGVETSFKIKRTEFGMDKLLQGVGDDVLLIVSLEAGHK